MSEAKHTPGPWFVDGLLIWAGDFGQTPVCLMGYPAQCAGDTAEDFPNLSANRDLIAAAPDLLEACEALTHWDECWPSAALGEALRKARAALAKAKGGA